MVFQGEDVEESLQGPSSKSSSYVSFKVLYEDIVYKGDMCPFPNPAQWLEKFQPQVLEIRGILPPEKKKDFVDYYHQAFETQGAAIQGLLVGGGVMTIKDLDFVVFVLGDLSERQISFAFSNISDFKAPLYADEVYDRCHIIRHLVCDRIATFCWPIWGADEKLTLTVLTKTNAHLVSPFSVMVYSEDTDESA